MHLSLSLYLWHVGESRPLCCDWPQLSNTTRRNYVGLCCILSTDQGEEERRWPSEEEEEEDEEEEEEEEEQN